jgi:hypothetical protein
MRVIEWVRKSPSGSAGEFWSRSESMIISWKRGFERVLAGSWERVNATRVGMKEACSAMASD